MIPNPVLLYASTITLTFLLFASTLLTLDYRWNEITPSEHAVIWGGAFIVGYGLGRITQKLWAWWLSQGQRHLNDEAERDAAYLMSVGEDQKTGKLGYAKTGDRQAMRRARVAAARRRSTMRADEDREAGPAPTGPTTGGEDDVIAKGRAPNATLEERMAARRARVERSKKR